MSKKKIGILGYGKLGQFILREFLENPKLSNLAEPCFVWNRSPIPKTQLDSRVKYLEKIDELTKYDPDLIIEVAHPSIVQNWGSLLLSCANVFIGSPTVFCDREFEDGFIQLANEKNRSVICGKGALPGLQEILELAEVGFIDSFFIRMRKAPESINFHGKLPNDYAKYIKESKPFTLYSGNIRELGKLAPNNVNTMVIAAMASGLGLDKVQGELISVPGLDHHEVYWNAKSKRTHEDLKPFSLELKKCNPAKVGAVTGKLTYHSFITSIVKALEIDKPGLSFC